MKKVLIGILILIPIIILLVIAIMTNLLSVQAWVSVDDIEISFKNSSSRDSLELSLSDLAGKKHNFKDFINVKVMPEKANRYTLEWEMGKDSLVCTDSEYDQEYKEYQETNIGTPIPPAAMLVDGSGGAVDSNSSGDFVVNAYCSFNVIVRAETVSKHFTVIVKGYTVESVKLLDVEERSDTSIKIGESKRLVPHYSPLDSIVEELTFASNNDSVATVDKNGIVTAVGVGSAKITASASKYGEGGYVVSTEYAVTVLPAASKWGDSVRVDRRANGTYTFDELGLDERNVTAGEGYELVSGGVKIVDDKVDVQLQGGGTLAVSVVEPDAIVIRNASMFNFAKDGDFVLEVGPLKLSLSADWASDLKDGEPTVSWTSSEPAVATIDANGVVKPESSGITVITASTESGSHASILLNVQNKISSIRLLTSNASMSVGLARETIYAAEKYVYDADEAAGDNKFQKTPNSVLIRVQGEPDANANQNEILYFYLSYNFEVVEGNEYAHFDETDNHKLIFDPSAIEGNGKVNIKVRVSAKYPRYEGVQTHTVEEVTVKAVYGVEVDNWDKLMRASAEQREYTEREEFYTEPSVRETLEAPNGQTYKVIDASRTTGDYAIVLTADIPVPENLTLTEDRRDDTANIYLYSELYGNDHLLSSHDEQVLNGSSVLLRIYRDNVTVSNVRLRVNDVPTEDISKASFAGRAIYATYEREPGWIDRSFHMSDVKVEYSIIECADIGVLSYNTDLKLDGCIVRNISGQGMYCWVGVSKDDSSTPYDDTLVFEHIGINNTVFASIRAMSISYDFTGFSLINEGDRNGRFGRFGADPTDREASFAWVEEVLKPKGYVPKLIQTGFFDIYNWQNVKNTAMLEFGIKEVDDLVSLLAETILTKHPAFEKFKYKIIDPESGFEDDYFHLGFMTSGIKWPNFDERPMLVVEMEDDRFEAINCRELYDDPSFDGALSLYISILNQMEITFYSYTAASSLTPMSEFVLNGAMIDRLHS